MLNSILAWNPCEPFGSASDQPQQGVEPRKPAFTTWNHPVRPGVASAAPAHVVKGDALPPDDEPWLAPSLREAQQKQQKQQEILEEALLLARSAADAAEAAGDLAQKKGRAQPQAQPASQRRSSLDVPPNRPPPPRPKVTFDTVAATHSATTPRGRGGGYFRGGSAGAEDRGGVEGQALRAAEQPPNGGILRVGGHAVDPKPQNLKPKP